MRSINGLSNGKWALKFNPDPSKQAQEIIFSRKTKNISYNISNNNIVSQTPYQKHLGIFLDAWLAFEDHFKVVTTKVNKTNALLHKFQKFLPRLVLITIYKAFVRQHLDYGYVIHDEAYNKTFHQKLESIQ